MIFIYVQNNSIHCRGQVLTVFLGKLDAGIAKLSCYEAFFFTYSVKIPFWVKDTLGIQAQDLL